MQMVLSAIFINASEAMEGKGSIQVTCRNKRITDETIIDFPSLKPGDYVKITIKDDGKGMDEDTRSSIFEPFFTTKFQGRGLGMAASYGIIKNHDGWISVDSELGKGTAVHIYLPAVETPVKEPKKPKIEPARGTGTILVIEDEEMIMDIFLAILERLGYHVLGAKTGKQAISIAETFDGDIDLAILDIVLPDMDGKSIYPRIMEARPSLKVLVCSGYSIDGPAQDILDAGAQDFIQKPFTIGEIAEKLKKILGGQIVRFG
jgi:CheY-like chemotaxis protein